jgi:hypothetical protein
MEIKFLFASALSFRIVYNKYQINFLIMDSKTKLYVFGGLSVSLAGAALLLYFLDSGKAIDESLLAKIKALTDSIEEHFK